MFNEKNRAACKTRLVLPRLSSFSGKNPVKLRFSLEALTKLKFCKSLNIIKNTAKSVEQLFPQLKDAGNIVAEGKERRDSYFELVKNIDILNKSNGLTYIY